MYPGLKGPWGGEVGGRVYMSHISSLITRGETFPAPDLCTLKAIPEVVAVHVLLRTTGIVWHCPFGAATYRWAEVR